MERKYSPEAVFILIFAALIWGGTALYFSATAPKLFNLAIDGASWQTASGGLVPKSMDAGGPAEKAGLLATDTLLSANGVSVSTAAGLQEVIDQTPKGARAIYTVRRRDGLVKLEVPVQRNTSEMVWHWLLKLAGFLYIFLALLVFIKKPQLKLAQLFLFFASSAGWLLAVGFVDYSHLSRPLYLFFFVWLRFNIFFIMVLALDFVRRLLFFSPLRQPSPALTALTYLPALVGFTLSMLPLVLYLTHVRTAIEWPTGVFWTKIRDLLIPLTYAIYLVWFVTEMTMRGAKKQEVTSPRQGEWLQWGVGLPMSLYVVFGILIRSFINLPLLDWSQFFLLPPPFVFAYLILKERMMDIGVVIKRSAIYAILSALLIGTFVLLVLAASELVVFMTGQESKLAIFAAALITALVGNLYRQKTQDYLDRKFFKDRHNYQKSLLEFSKDLSRLEEVEPLLAKVSCEFAGALHLSNCLPFIYDQKTDAYVMVAPYCLEDQLLLKIRYSASTFGLTTLLVQQKRPLEFYDLETNSLFAHLPVAEKVALKKTDTALAVPLLVKEKLVGMLLLGNKKSGDYFSPEDLDFFATLSAPLAVAVENARLYKEELEKHEMEKELDVARQIQEKLVSQDLPKFPGIDLSATYVPSKQVSGDIYLIVPMDGHRLVLAVGDVSGKGVPAALLMATVRASLMTMVEEKLPPHQIVSRLNRLVFENTDSRHFVTFFFGLYDSASRKLSYVNAGHNPPVYFSPNGNCRELHEGGLFLGMFSENRYEAGQLILEPGAPIILYTDGVTEAENHSEEQFGVQRLTDLVQAHRQLPAEELSEKILNGLRQFCDGRELGDDVSLVILKAV